MISSIFFQLYKNIKIKLFMVNISKLFGVIFIDQVYLLYTNIYKNT